MNGIEAMRRASPAAAAAIAGCAPDERSASLHRTVLASLLRTFVGSAPDTRRRDTSVAREKATRVASTIATAVPWPGQLDRDAAGDQDRRQAHRSGQPGELTPAAQRQDRLADGERGGAENRDGCVRP